MKQVVRRVIDRRGRVQVIDLPEPHLGPDQVLVQAHYSLISSGTNVRRVLRPGGTAYVMLYDRWSLVNLAHRVLRLPYKSPRDRRTIARSSTRSVGEA
jgi:hypothetical protein